MIQNFSRHLPAFDVCLVRLQESHTEPLRAEALFLNEDSLCKSVKFGTYCLLLLLSKINRREFLVECPLVEVGIAVGLHFRLVAPHIMPKPKHLFKVKHNDVFVVHLKRLLAKTHCFLLVFLSLWIPLLGLYVKAGHLADNVWEANNAQILAHVACDCFETSVLRLNHVESLWDHTVLGVAFEMLAKVFDELSFSQDSSTR
jgi:hypothetical protein